MTYLTGRRRSLLLALLVNATFGLLSAGSTTVFQLIVLRFLAGLGVGGSVPLVFSTMGEFCTASTRGKFMAMTASFWMIGSLFSAAIGWSIIPTAGWRVFVVVASLPAWAVVLLVVTWLPESPRFLLVNGKADEALKVLHRVAATNGRRLPDDLVLKTIHGSNHTHGRAHHIAPESWGVYIARQWKMCQSVLHTLLIAEPLKTSIDTETFIVALSNLPGNIASFYLVDAIGRRLTACVCMAVACVCALLFAAAPAHGVWPLVAACVFNGISVGGWNSLDLISAELYPTSVRSTGFGLLSSVGRLSSFITTLAVFLCHFSTSTPGSLHSLWSTKLDFATLPLHQVRSTGFGLLSSVGRLSSFITTLAAGALLDLALWSPLVVAAVLLAAGSTAMMMLPEPAGKALEDLVGQHNAPSDQEFARLLDPAAEGSDHSPSPAPSDPTPTATSAALSY
eukprot:gene25299-10953_t